MPKVLVTVTLGPLNYRTFGYFQVSSIALRISLALVRILQSDYCQVVLISLQVRMEQYSGNKDPIERREVIP